MQQEATPHTDTPIHERLRVILDTLLRNHTTIHAGNVDDAINLSKLLESYGKTLKGTLQEQLKHIIAQGESIRTDEYLIQHRKASSTTAVNTAAVKAMLPEEGHPELYKKQQRTSSIAMQRLPKQPTTWGKGTSE